MPNGILCWFWLTPFYHLKVISGDDDLPTRDDIGERRRKYELQMLARAGVQSKNDTSIHDSDNSDGDVGVMKENAELDSEDEFYKQVKQQRAAKLAAEAEIYSKYVLSPLTVIHLLDYVVKLIFFQW